MEHSQELAQQIRARIGELEADLEAHRRALAILEAPQSGTRPSSNGAPRRRTPRRRPQPVSTEAVFDALNDGNDQAAIIAKEFGVSTAVVRHRLEQLEQAGRVSRSGERRGTRWRSHAAS
jgi:predicted Rossmann fold nucleotide-binding protein DprA/Smf involved in DNA uptake